MGEYYKTSEQNEEEFQSAWENYWHQKTSERELKAEWDKMFFSVLFACENICKSICTRRNIIIQDLDEVAMDSTIYVMKFIKKGVRPKKLSSYCYLRCRYILDAPKKVWYEQHITQMPLDGYKNSEIELVDESNIDEETKWEN